MTSIENPCVQQPGPVRFIVRNAKHALQPQPPIEPIVDGLIYRGNLIMPYGESGSKKTYSFLSLLVCVAMNKKWLGFKTYQTKVLIVDEESGDRRLSRRLAEIIRGESGDEKIELYYVSLANFKLDDPTDATIVQALIEELGVGLVLIDALAEIMDGDENSKKDTQPVLAALRKIADSTNSAIIVIHHSNKAGGYRGSSAIKGAVDLMIEVKSNDGSRLINYKTVKERDIERISWSAEAVWDDGRFYLRPVEKIDRSSFSSTEEYVIRFLRQHKTASIKMIINNVETCTAEAAKKAVYTLKSKGIVIRKDFGGRGVRAEYMLKENDCEL